MEVVVYGIGFPWEKLRRNRSGEHSDASNCLWRFPSTRAQQATKPDCLRKVRTCKQKIICQTPEKWGASLHSNLLPVAKKTYDENRFYFLLKVWDPWTYGHFCAGKRWIIMYSCGQLLFCQLLLKTGVGDHCNFCKCVHQTYESRSIFHQGNLNRSPNKFSLESLLTSNMILVQVCTP